MTVAPKSVSRLVAECDRIRDSWSDTERARRRKLGETRRLRLLRLLQSMAKQQVA